MRRPAHEAKAAKAANTATPSPAADPKTAQLVSLQSLALEALAEGNYAEPREGNAIAYSQQALALNPSSEYSRTLLENSEINCVGDCLITKIVRMKMVW